jgi:hypothetical protein
VDVDVDVGKDVDVGERLKCWTPEWTTIIIHYHSIWIRVRTISDVLDLRTSTIILCDAFHSNGTTAEVTIFNIARPLWG